MATKHSKVRVSKKAKVMNNKRKTIRRKNKLSRKTNGGGGFSELVEGFGTGVTHSAFVEANQLVVKKAKQEEAKIAAQKAEEFKSMLAKEEAVKRNAFATSHIGTVPHNVGPTKGHLAIHNELQSLRTRNENNLHKSLTELTELANSEKNKMKQQASNRARDLKRLQQERLDKKLKEELERANRLGPPPNYNNYLVERINPLTGKIEYVTGRFSGLTSP